MVSAVGMFPQAEGIRFLAGIENPTGGGGGGGGEADEVKESRER